MINISSVGYSGFKNWRADISLMNKANLISELKGITQSTFLPVAGSVYWYTGNLDLVLSISIIG